MNGKSYLASRRFGFASFFLGPISNALWGISVQKKVNIEERKSQRQQSKQTHNLLLIIVVFVLES